MQAGTAAAGGGTNRAWSIFNPPIQFWTFHNSPGIPLWSVPVMR